MRPTGIRVLLIDDSPFDAELARRALRGLAAPPGPVEVVCAGDWAEAIPQLEVGGFDLLLLDYNLPGLTGLDVLHELQRHVHPPVIMMTGQGDIATAVETLRGGAYDYVPKSADCGPTLCLAIERVLERVRLEREVAEARARLAAHAAELEHKVATRTAVVLAQAAEIEALYLKGEEAAHVKAQILNNVSHELRTPLNLIVGYVELLQRGLSGGAGVKPDELFAKLRGQVAHMDRLVGSLLTLNRLHAGTEDVEVSRFALAGLVAELRSEVEALNADRGLTFTWTVLPEPCDVEHDRAKVRAIAYHLLSNAIKFTPAGRVDVTAAVRAGGGLVLTVADTGIGLPPEAEAVALDDFRQVDGSTTRRYGGLGLGLGIVRRYAALLGGTIRFEGHPGTGTTVVVDLPPALRPLQGVVPLVTASLPRPSTAPD